MNNNKIFYKLCYFLENYEHINGRKCSKGY